MIVYPIIAGNERQDWYDNFFPSPNAPDACVVHYHSECGDHGSTTGLDRGFVYDPEREAWVMIVEHWVDCSAEFGHPADPR